MHLAWHRVALTRRRRTNPDPGQWLGEHMVQGDERMLSWALTFLVIALIAAALGFGGVAGAATGIAKILFVVFLVLFLVSLIVPRFRGPV
jgi:uncharacterized membrane protein YtjA (UPF0391 family)